jgi:hypothetical protein
VSQIYADLVFPKPVPQLFLRRELQDGVRQVGSLISTSSCSIREYPRAAHPPARRTDVSVLHQANREIAAGEELTWDYGGTPVARANEAESTRATECACGAAK